MEEMGEIKKQYAVMSTEALKKMLESWKSGVKLMEEELISRDEKSVGG